MLLFDAVKVDMIVLFKIVEFIFHQADLPVLLSI